MDKSYKVKNIFFLFNIAKYINVFLCDIIFNNLSLCISAVKQYLCVTLSKNGVSNVNEARWNTMSSNLFPHFLNNRLRILTRKFLFKLAFIFI